MAALACCDRGAQRVVAPPDFSDAAHHAGEPLVGVGGLWIDEMGDQQRGLGTWTALRWKHLLTGQRPLADLR
jgi:hypothetical protein